MDMSPNTVGVHLGGSQVFKQPYNMSCNMVCSVLTVIRHVQVSLTQLITCHCLVSSLSQACQPEGV